MATDRRYVCERCGTREWVSRLCDTLQDQAAHRVPKCTCGGQRHIELGFEFDLRCEVLAAFLPEPIPHWVDKRDGSQWRFLPFLVFLESLEDKVRWVWTPYWHLVTYKDGAVETKYGQFAACIAADAYQSMVNKARNAGFEV